MSIDLNPPSSFQRWLTSQADRTDSVGDLARFAAATPSWPKHTDDKAALRTFLRGSKAAHLIQPLAVAHTEWREQRASLNAAEPEREIEFARVRTSGLLLKKLTTRRFLLRQGWVEGERLIQANAGNHWTRTGARWRREDVEVIQFS